MGTNPEWSRDAILSAIAAEARAMVDDGFLVSDGLHTALDRMDWRAWADDSGPSPIEELKP
jgi:hypothetical protein